MLRPKTSKDSCPPEGLTKCQNSHSRGTEEKEATTHEVGDCGKREYLAAHYFIRRRVKSRLLKKRWRLSGSKANREIICRDA